MINLNPNYKQNTQFSVNQIISTQSQVFAASLKSTLCSQKLFLEVHKLILVTNQQKQTTSVHLRHPISNVRKIKFSLVIYIQSILQSGIITKFSLYQLQLFSGRTMDHESEEKSGSEAQYEGRWTTEQHSRFIRALMTHGKNWKLIQETVDTRTTSQVRSHAQKFFLKLQKIEKQRKRNLKKGLSCSSLAQQQLVQSLCDQSITPNTPSEILHFLKKDTKQKSQAKPEQSAVTTMLLKEQEKKRTSKVLDQMMKSNQEDSFFISLMYHINRYSKNSKNLIGGAENFSELIDLPGIHKEEEQTANKRKRSFSLYEEQEDPQKYHQMVKRMHGQ